MLSLGSGGMRTSGSEVFQYLLFFHSSQQLSLGFNQLLSQGDVFSSKDPVDPCLLWKFMIGT